MLKTTLQSYSLLMSVCGVGRTANVE